MVNGKRCNITLPHGTDYQKIAEDAERKLNAAAASECMLRNVI